MFAHRTLPGIGASAIGAALAFGVHARLPQLPTLVTALVFGIVLGNVTGFRQYAAHGLKAGLEFSARWLLPAGIVLLGAGASSSAIAAAWPVAPLTVGTAVIVFVAVLLLGKAWRLPGGKLRELATGFALGRPGDRTSVPVAVGATIAAILLPAIGDVAGLGRRQFGFWSGAGVPSLGRAIAAGDSAGGAAAGTAVVAVLVRLLLLSGVHATTGGRKKALAPVIVVAGFAVAAAIGTAIPGGFVDTAATAALAAALLALGAQLKISSIYRIPARMAGASAMGLVVMLAVTWMMALAV